MWWSRKKHGQPGKTGWYVTWDDRGIMGAAHFTTTEEYSQWDMFGCPSLEGCISEMDHLLAWQPIPPEEAWISVKDELPEESGKYLTRQPDEQDPDGFYYESLYFSRKHGRWNDFDVLPDDGGVDNKINAAVTHWAPLPEEPKRGELS